jgi:hypothetical protein
VLADWSHVAPENPQGTAQSSTFLLASKLELKSSIWKSLCLCAFLFSFRSSAVFSLSIFNLFYSEVPLIFSSAVKCRACCFFFLWSLALPMDFIGGGMISADRDRSGELGNSEATAMDASDSKASSDKYMDNGMISEL